MSVDLRNYDVMAKSGNAIFQGTGIQNSDALYSCIDDDKDR